MRSARRPSARLFASWSSSTGESFASSSESSWTAPVEGAGATFAPAFGWSIRAAVAHLRDDRASALRYLERAEGEFTRLGLLTVPAALIPAVVALWASLLLIGG